MKAWTTKNSLKIPIKNLEDEHLINIIRMLRRVHQQEISTGYSCLAMLQGEMATYYAEQDLSRMEEKEFMHPLYDDLIVELRKRKLEKKL